MPLERLKATWPAVPRPWRRSVVVLCVIFCTEYSLMIALTWLLPADSPRFLEAAVDAVLLTIVVSPVIWWTSVRPLQQAARLRDHFLADLFATIEDERRRIAHELHDGVGQSLTMLVVGLRSLAEGGGPAELESKEEELRQLAQRALADTKQLARGLRPSLLDDLGLAAAIERVAAEVEEIHQLPVSVNMHSMTGQRLPEKCESALFRIFQEALANVVQHAGASQISVRLAREPQHVTLTVVDNGCGMDSTTATTESGAISHLGLIGMQERAALLRGNVVIDSAKGRGTTITATIPV